MSPSFGLIVLYVGDPIASAEFYRRLAGATVLEAQATFAMVSLIGGVRLGLWRRQGVEPPATQAAGASELDFIVETPEALHQTFRDWSALAAKVAQPILSLDFGQSFVITDPDGHRIRVLLPGGEP